MFDDDDLPDPIKLGSTFGRIIESASSEEYDEFEEIVSSEQYRDAFMRSLRAMTPDGKALNGVEVIGHGRFSSTFAHLTPALAKEITSRLSRTSPNGVMEGSRLDVLRGLNLNEGWILLGKEKGQEQKWYVREGVVLADVVEDLIDQPVRVTGTMDRKRRRYYIDDLEAVEQDGNSASERLPS